MGWIYFFLIIIAFVLLSIERALSKLFTKLDELHTSIDEWHAEWTSINRVESTAERVARENGVDLNEDN